MVLIDRNRHIAIALRRGRAGVVIVEHTPRRLACRALSEREFREDWQECDYPLAEAVERFLGFAASVGATRQALAALERLRGDPLALAPRLI